MAKVTETIRKSLKQQCFSRAIILSLCKIIQWYRLLFGVLLGERCRFFPSCSRYSEQAFRQWGLLKGSLLTVKRLLKCHPWHPGGCDPVPESHKTSV